MILVPFFTISTAYGSTKNLLSLPFQAPVFFGLGDRSKVAFEAKALSNVPNFPLMFYKKDKKQMTNTIKEA